MSLVLVDFLTVCIPTPIYLLLYSNCFRTQRSSHVERPAICEIFPDVCVVQVGIAVYSYWHRMKWLISRDRARNLLKYRRQNLIIFSLLEARTKTRRKFTICLFSWRHSHCLAFHVTWIPVMVSIILMSFKLITLGLRYSVWLVWQIIPVRLPVYFDALRFFFAHEQRLASLSFAIFVQFLVLIVSYF